MCTPSIWIPLGGGDGLLGLDDHGRTVGNKLCARTKEPAWNREAGRGAYIVERGEGCMPAVAMAVVAVAEAVAAAEAGAYLLLAVGALAVDRVDGEGIGDEAVGGDGEEVAEEDRVQVAAVRAARLNHQRLLREDVLREPNAEEVGRDEAEHGRDDRVEADGPEEGLLDEEKAAETTERSKPT